MRVTLIPVTYRDTNGIQTHGELRLDGELTTEQRQAVKAALLGGREFVPGQVGLSHYGSTECASFPGPHDHGWHTLLLDAAVVVPCDERCWTGAGVPDFGGTPEQFLTKLQAAAAAGWTPAIHGT